MTPPSSAGHNLSRSLLRLWSAHAVIVVCMWASNAPTVLFPLYTDRLALTPIAITLLFAAYPAALIAMLIIAGSDISQVIGVKRAMLAGSGIVLVGSVIFAFAMDFSMLLVARAVQGVGVGLALAAASATVMDEAQRRRPGSGSGATTVSVAVGLLLSLVLGGAIVQLAPAPEITAHLALATVCTATFVALCGVSRDTPQSRRWRPGVQRVPRGLGGGVVRAALGVTIAFAVGAVFASFAARIARELVPGAHMIVIGGLLGVSSVIIAVGGLFVSRLPSRTLLAVGSLACFASTFAMAMAVTANSLLMFVLWCVVGGMGYAFAFGAGIGSVQDAAPSHQRAGVLSLVYTISYFAQSVIVVVVGMWITNGGMTPAMSPVVAGVGALCVAGVIVAVRTKPRPAAS